ncbi:MAG: serine/threonine-protein kinase [Kineosporiaceae bacterium]
MSLGIPGVEQLQEIGRGGSGIVYRGWQPAFGRWVAIKVFPIDEDARRLERERHALGQLSDHPGIAPVFGGGITADGRAYLVMGYMEGGSLRDRVMTRGPLSNAETIAFGRAMATALQIAHAHGIWHRDIKPANILYDRFGAPRLADFGIAHVGDDGFRTGTGKISGTAAYLAPELLEGRPFTAASDVFSLGATVYYALTGEPLFSPYEGESAATFMLRRLTRPEPPRFSASVPRWLNEIITAATAPDPDLRTPTAAQLAAAFTAGPEESGVVEPPTMGRATITPPVPPQGGPSTFSGETPMPTGWAGSTPTPPTRMIPAPGASGDGVATTAHRSADFGQPDGTGQTPGTGSGTGAGTGTGTGQPPGIPLPPGPGQVPAAGPPRPYGPYPPQAPGGTPPPVAGPTPIRPRRVLATALTITLLVLLGLGGGTYFIRSVFASSSSGISVVPNLTANGSGSSDPSGTSDTSGTGAPSGTGDSSGTDSTNGAGDSTENLTDLSGSEAVQAAVDAFRTASGSSDPYMVEMTFYPFPDSGDTPEVTWSAMGSMMSRTDKTCRGAMEKADLPDEPDQFGDTAGLGHVIVERDDAFSNNKVVVLVYFSGGARWSGGYIRYSATGKLLRNYCTVD